MSTRLIVLASTSPRRGSLLNQIGLPFTVADPGEVETSTAPSPSTRAVENASKKVESVAAGHPHSIIIGADTIVVLGGKMLGKPRSKREAREMLRNLRGAPHIVVTGLAVLDTDTGKTENRTVETRVFMRDIPDDELEAYVASGEPLGKAGGYAIQGSGAVFVEKVEGCFFNVVGLPLPALYDILKSFGVDIWGEQRASNIIFH
jgi:septum formation protein